MRNEHKTIPDCLFAACLALCMAIGLMGCFLSIIGQEELMGKLFHGYSVRVVLYVILCSLVHIHVKARMIGLPLIAALTCFIAAWNRAEVLGSGTNFLNRAADIINSYYGIGFKTGLSGAEDMSSSEMAAGLMVFFLILLFFLSLEAGWFLNAWRACSLFTGLILFGLCVGKMPLGEYTFLSAAAVIALFACGRNKDKSKGMHIKPVNQAAADKKTLFGGRSVAAFVTLAIFGAAAGIGFLFAGYLGETLLAWHAPVQQWANKQEQKMLHFNFHGLFSKQGAMQAASKKLSNDKITYTGREIMVLTMNEPPAQPLYLRGFIGGEYRSNEWKEADEGIFLEETVQNIENFELEPCWELVRAEDSNDITKEDVARAVVSMGYDRAKTLADNSIFIQSSLWLSSQVLSKDTDSLCIEYKNASGDYGYFPYFTRLVGSDQIRGGSALRRVNDKKEMLESIKLTVCANLWKYFNIENIQDSYQVEEVLSWSRQSFQELEESYRQYVKEVYTVLPEEGLEKLWKFCREHPRQEKRATEFIRGYLSDFSYTLSPGPLPRGEDITEFFLFSGKKGYCIHFATAATLMYRMYGIPARFVEGYVAWPENFKEVTDENGNPVYRAVITDQRAHAWTEIYVDNIGFVPMDMTPASSISIQEDAVQKDSAVHNSPQENMQADVEEEERDHEREDQTENGFLNESAQDTAEQEKSETANENYDEKENSKTTEYSNGKQSLSKTAAQRALPFMAAGIFFCVVVCLLLCLARKIRILYYQRVYKGHIAGISDDPSGFLEIEKTVQDPRKALCLAAAVGFEYIRLCGEEERHWEKETRVLSRQEWNKWFYGEYSFLETGEYIIFYNLAMRAMYAPPEENFTVQDAIFGFDFLKKMRAVLVSRMPKNNQFYLEMLDQMIGLH